MAANSKKPQTMDEYIADFPEDIQAILSKLRATIHAAAPDAQETIKYAMPTFTLKGNLIYFAAFKKHIGLFPLTADIKKKLGRQLVGYEGTKDSVRLPLDQPIPYSLISKMVKVRVKEDLAYAKKKDKEAAVVVKAKGKGSEKKK